MLRTFAETLGYEPSTLTEFLLNST